MNDLKSLLAFHRPFHSNLQIDRWIIGKSGCTDYGMFKQALRELHSRLSALTNLWLDIEDTEAARPIKRTDIVRKAMRLEGQRSTFEDTLREFARFLQHARILHARLIGNEPLTPERIEQLDREEWYAQLERMAAIECATFGRASQGTLDSVMALDSAAREPLLQTLMLDGLPAKQHLARVLARPHAVPVISDEAVSMDEIRQMIEGDVARYALESKEIPVARYAPDRLEQVLPIDRGLDGRLHIDTHSRLNRGDPASCL